MLWPDPAQRHRLAEIRDNFLARIAEAEREGWLGVAEADWLGKPVERLDPIGRRRHPPTQRRVREVAQELDGADRPADLAEGRVEQPYPGSPRSSRP